MAISNDTIVVAAYGDDTGATDAGSAYVFDATSGNLLWTLNNPTPVAYDLFGKSVAVSGSTIVVGAYWDDTGATDAGSAYVFDAASGSLLRTLNNPAPASDHFGTSVAISGSTIVVGADEDNAGATDSGSAYVFDAVSSNLLWTLNNPTPAAYDLFGISVAVSGSTLVVGAYQDDTGATNAGSAYVFDAASGSLLRSLNNPGDYTAVRNQTLTFSPNGSLTQTVTVNAIGDTQIESDETFTISLSNPVGATLGTATATGTIQNDDFATVTLTATDDAAGEPSNNGTYRISRTGSTTSALTVNFIVGGDATRGSTGDYELKKDTTLGVGQHGDD